MFNRFDILSAYYLFGMLYHCGMFTKEYRDMCRVTNMGFQPADSLSYESLSDNGKEIYNNLVSSWNRRLRAQRRAARRTGIHA